MSKVEITGCAKDFEIESCMDLLRSFVGLGASDAKSVSAKILAGERQQISVRSSADARLLTAALTKLGASARQLAEAE